MPVYANAEGFTDQRRHPRALMLIVGGHAVLIAAVMTAKMEMPEGFIPTITRVTLIDPPKPPPEPPQPPPPKQQAAPRDSAIDRPPPVLPIPADQGPIVDRIPIPLPDPGPIIGTNPDPAPNPVPAAVRTGPRFSTPEWAIKPPYPDDKRRLEEEAVLRLKLTIDERGRVIAVEPVGKADRSFFESARKHVLAHWRYKPATEDGRPVASSTVITLRFELES